MKSEVMLGLASTLQILMATRHHFSISYYFLIASKARYLEFSFPIRTSYLEISINTKLTNSNAALIERFTLTATTPPLSQHLVLPCVMLQRFHFSKCIQQRTMLFSSKHRPLPAIAYAWLSFFWRQCLLQRKVGSQDSS